MTENEIQLIKKAQAGNREAFEQLVYKYDRHVLNIAYSFRNDTDDAKDIYQEVFIRVYKGLKNFEFKSAFSTWIYRITTNVCITQNNVNNRRQLDSLATEVENSDEKLSDFIQSEDKTDNMTIKNETNQIINKAIDLLPAQQKMAFTLKHINEYKIKEIANIMNCNEGTVKRYLFNATGKLKTILLPFLQN